jgi:hypothetical protein
MDLQLFRPYAAGASQTAGAFYSPGVHLPPLQQEIAFAEGLPYQNILQTTL